MTYGYTSTSTCSAALTGPSLAQICGTSAFVVFMSLLDDLVRSNDKISRRCERIEPIENPDEEYDFVVIGGGGGGAPVAGRLSENPDWKVLLLEAGGDEPPVAEVPLFVSFLGGTVLDWNFTTTNERNACLATNGTCSLTAAKMLGGCTAHNAMKYLRGNPMDFNNWAALGNEGWTWEEVKKFYLLAEDNREIERVGRKNHATGGPVPVARFSYVPPIGHAILDAADEAGYGVTEDLNGDQIMGFTLSQATHDNGIRVSSATAYLLPARDRKNLHVSLNSRATRVIIDKEKAVGVEYYQNGELKRVRASKEVVVSAGTILSPQVLLLSGIGPKKHLDSVGVKVVKDLPGVGENLHNHIAYTLSFTINEADRYDNDWAIAFEYLANQTGPLSSIGMGQVVGTFKTHEASPDWPDLQLFYSGYGEVCAPGRIGQLRSTTGKRTVGARAVNLRPRSRGKISLISKDPLAYPNIWFNYLSDQRDVDGMVRSIEVALELTKTPTMRAWNLTLANTPLDACSKYTFATSEYWACAVRQDAALELHQAGSCKMGPASDPMAVVDARLRVHGIQGLRVADASIMPQVTSANTAAPTMMIGERAADFIKKDWAKKSGRETDDCKDDAKHSQHHQFPKPPSSHSSSKHPGGFHG